MADFQQFDGRSDEELIAAGLQPTTVQKYRQQSAPMLAEAPPVDPSVDNTFVPDVMAMDVQAPEIEAPTQPERRMETDEEKSKRVIERLKTARIPIPDADVLAELVANEPTKEAPLTSEQKKQKYAQQNPSSAFGEQRQPKSAQVEPAKPVEAAVAAPEPIEEEEPLSAEEEQQHAEHTKQLIHKAETKNSAANDFERLIAKHEAMLDDLHARIKKGIDPDRYLNSRTTGQRIAAGFAVGLGNASSGGDAGSRMLQSAIDRDVAAQREQLSNEYNILKEKGDLLALRAKAKEGPPDFVSDHHEIQALNTAIAKSKVYMNKPRANQANLTKMVTDLEIRRNKKIAEVQAKMADGKYRQPDHLVDKDTPRYMLSKETAEVFVPGYGPAYNKEDKERFQIQRAKSEPSIEGIKRIQSLARNGSKLSPENRAKIQTETLMLSGALKEAIVGGGAMTLDEFNRIMKTIGDPNKILTLSGVEQAKMNQVLKKLEEDLDRQASATFPNYKSKSSLNLKPRE